MFCNNKSGQVEYHDYCWEQTDKIGVIHSKEIVNMSNTGNIQLASELSVAVQTIKTAGYTLAMGYDNMHRITSKSQHLTQQNLQFNGTLNECHRDRWLRSDVVSQDGFSKSNYIYSE